LSIQDLVNKNIAKAPISITTIIPRTCGFTRVLRTLFPKLSVAVSSGVPGAPLFPTVKLSVVVTLVSVPEVLVVPVPV